MYEKDRTIFYVVVKKKKNHFRVESKEMQEGGDQQPKI